MRGAGTLIVDVLAITALQRSLPSDVLARVFGAYFTLVLAAISLGALVTPQVIASAGLDASLWLAGLGIPALCLLGWPLLRRMDEANVAVTRRARAAGRRRCSGSASSPRRPARCSSSWPGPPQEVDVAAGTTVIREGDEADALYVLLDGEMAVRARGESGVDARAADDGRRHATSARSACWSGSRGRPRSPASARAGCCGSTASSS